MISCVGDRRPIRLLAAAVVLGVIALGAADPIDAPAEASQRGPDAVRVWTIHYRAHNGMRRVALVVLPAWYDAENAPPIPLVISPHGRGVTAAENVKRWGNLPGEGGFAVVNPSGQGRRLHLYSWGYAGQIHDLATMPGIVERALPWLTIDRSRIYAFGTSMGGQETLLLAALHPSLLAGAAAFDAVTDMAARYRSFRRLRCTRACERRWREPLGPALQSLAREEIGGTPAESPKAYARRSPLQYVRRLALSGLPLQLWWSTADKVVGPRTQSERFARALRRLAPAAPLEVHIGAWRHASEMGRHAATLREALRAFDLLPHASAARTPASSARLVHPLLPWHRAVLDRNGKLLAWYRPEANLGYDRVLRLGWDFIERRVPRDRRSGAKVYLRYAVFDGRTLRGIYWQHNPAFVHASFVDSVVAWYPYSGDRRAIAAVREMLDYQLDHGLTPARWAWAGVPFSTACAGEQRYGRCLAGLPRRFYGGLEPDKVGLLGLGYVRFYELTGERRFLRAGITAANALARHVRVGDAQHTPWPFRVDGRTGRVVDGAEFGGAVAGPLGLFDELIRIGVGEGASYRRARNIALSWLLRHQLEPASPAWNRWSGFYEDVPYNPNNRNQAVPTLTAIYLLTRRDPGAVDGLWRPHATAALEWVRVSFGRGPFLGAWGVDEQSAPGRPGCCSPVGLGSTASRWAAANALLFARTGDPAARELAFRSLNYATYFAGSDGRIACCGRRSTNTYWFSDGYSDYLRSFSWAMAAIPELAPRARNHLLGSTSVVRRVAYARRSIVYTTFDRRAVDVLRLRFLPSRVTAGGGLLRLRRDLSAEGYTVARVGGDIVVRVRHDRARVVRISR
jgi:hypothetical protein